MKGAIFYSTKYGSTAEYANWIAAATKLPVYDIKNTTADPTSYDFLILGAPIIYHKLSNHKWVKSHWKKIRSKPIIFFSVSGAGAGTKLDNWIKESLPEELILKMKHIALRGRQIPKELTWFDRTMLIIAGLANRDKQAGKEEMQGFDYMDKTSIQPIVDLVKSYEASTV